MRASTISNTLLEIDRYRHTRVVVSAPIPKSPQRVQQWQSSTKDCSPNAAQPRPSVFSTSAPRPCADRVVSVRCPHRGCNKEIGSLSKGSAQPQSVYAANTCPRHPKQAIHLPKGVDERQVRNLCGKQVVVTTTENLCGVVPQFFNLQTVFEGNLLEYDVDQQTTFLTLAREHGHLEVLEIPSKLVRNIHPRNMNSRRETCEYFNSTGKCAFGQDCNKSHDPSLLSESAISALKGEDADIRQQLTLHLASIPANYEEHHIKKDFMRFGFVQSVNICQKPSQVESQKYWRNGFVTFASEKAALMAKTNLNEDRDSVWCGQIAFAKTRTKSAYSSNIKSLPRLASDIPRYPGNVIFVGAKALTLDAEHFAKVLQRFGRIKGFTQDSNARNTIITFAQCCDAAKALKFLQKDSHVLVTMAGLTKPSQQVYMQHKEETTFAKVEQCLGALGLKFNWMFVAKKQDYALVTFQSIEDSEHALYTVMAHAPDEWVLDFEPFNEKSLFKLQLQQYERLCQEIKNTEQKVADAWGDERSLGFLVSERKKLQVEQRELSCTLTRVVKQKLLQARVLVSGDHTLPKVTPRLAQEIGQDAVVFMELKHGSMQDFIIIEMCKEIKHWEPGCDDLKIWIDEHGQGRQRHEDMLTLCNQKPTDTRQTGMMDSHHRGYLCDVTNHYRHRRVCDMHSVF